MAAADLAALTEPATTAYKYTGIQRRAQLPKYSRSHNESAETWPIGTPDDDAENCAVPPVILALWTRGPLPLTRAWEMYRLLFHLAQREALFVRALGIRI